MPNKEEKKHFLKKKKDFSKKTERFIQPILSNSADDLSGFLDVGSRQQIQHNHDSIKDGISLPKPGVIFHKSCTESISRSEPVSRKLVTDDAIRKVDKSSDCIKRRPSKSQGAKFFFFPFLRKNSDLTQQIPTNKLLQQSSSSNTASIQNYDSTESSNTSFSSATSLFSASQLLYSTRSSAIESPCIDCCSSFGKHRRNSCNSSSFVIKNLQNDNRINYEMRPNSIAFPVGTPLPQSSVNIPISSDFCIRHSIAAMPHHFKEHSHGSIGNNDIYIDLHSGQFVDKCISYPSLENHHVWNTVNPSHPDYPKVAKNIMYCSKSQCISTTRYPHNHVQKRISLPSDGDSGVALDHHKRSMVFSGYNSLVYLEPSNNNLSLSSTSDCEPLQIDESSSRSSNEFESSTAKFSTSPHKMSSKYSLFRPISSDACQPTDPLCATIPSDILSSHPIYVDQYLSQVSLEECYPYQVYPDNQSHFHDIQQFDHSSYNSMVQQNNFQNIFQAINDRQKSATSDHIFRSNASNVKCNPLSYNFDETTDYFYKPRRTRSLKDRSHPNTSLSYPQNEIYSHGREISFYTYIAPDPNHSKEIPKWLQDYSREESLLQFAWADGRIDDLICWITLLGRLYKKELETLISKYEHCREDLISIIDERNEELVAERIALEKALISEETYV